MPIDPSIKAYSTADSVSMSLPSLKPQTQIQTNPVGIYLLRRGESG
jgi:hypothetical protein